MLVLGRVGFRVGEVSYSELPLIRLPLGRSQNVLITHFIAVKHTLGLSEWPKYRGGHISGVLIRGNSL